MQACLTRHAVSKKIASLQTPFAGPDKPCRSEAWGVRGRRQKPSMKQGCGCQARPIPRAIFRPCRGTEFRPDMIVAVEGEPLGWSSAITRAQRCGGLA